MNLRLTLFSQDYREPVSKKQQKNSKPGSAGVFLFPAHRRQRQEDLCESEANLVCRMTSRTAKVTLRNPVSKDPLKKREGGRKGGNRKESMNSYQLTYLLNQLPGFQFSFLSRVEV